jgi:Mn-containing catalase
MKLFPSPRIPTDKIPECRPHLEKGLHRILFRFSPEDFQEVKAVFNGPHPETGEDLVVAEAPMPEGAPAFDLPAQEQVFAPGVDVEEIAEIAQRLREQAGLGKAPHGVVAQDADGSNGEGVVGKVKDALS